jgi:hypothetical protein
MPKRTHFRTIGLAFFVWLSPLTTLAQDTPLASILPELLGNTITLRPSNIPDQPMHVAHFRPGADQLQAPVQVNQSLLTLLATYPTGTPAGGFTYIFDPALGSLTRSSDSFGPSFAERALTTGRGKVSVGFGYQHAAYDTFEGLNLRQRDTSESLNRRQRGITFYIPHTDCCRPGAAAASTPDGSRLTPPFEGDLIRAALALEVASDTSIVFASFGVTDRLDIGLAVPFVRVEVNASVLARIERLSTADDPSVHAFEGADPDQRLFRLSGVAAGLGDIVVRGKYALTSGRPFGLAAAVETRVPTGDESNLLGTGGVQTKVLGIASFHRGPISPHVNVGYTFSTKGALPNAELHDEVVATAGVDSVLTSRVTMSFDVLSRTLRDAGRMRLAEKTLDYAIAGSGTGGGGGGGGGGARPDPPSVDTRRFTYSEPQFAPGNLRLYLGAFGVRFSPWRTVLVTANLLFPLTDAGLRDRVTPVVGIDYAF